MLNGGQGNALKAKLNAAKQQVQNGNFTAARNQLNAFVNQVQAFVSAGILTPQQGAALIAEAQSIRQQLGA